jgi:hypothetical protein
VRERGGEVPAGVAILLILNFRYACFDVNNIVMVMIISIIIIIMMIILLIILDLKILRALRIQRNTFKKGF